MKREKFVLPKERIKHTNLPHTGAQRAEVLDYLVCGSSYPVGHAVLTDNKLPQKQFIKVT